MSPILIVTQQFGWVFWGTQLLLQQRQQKSRSWGSVPSALLLVCLLLLLCPITYWVAAAAATAPAAAVAVSAAAASAALPRHCDGRPSSRRNVVRRRQFRPVAVGRPYRRWNNNANNRPQSTNAGKLTAVTNILLREFLATARVPRDSYTFFNSLLPVYGLRVLLVCTYIFPEVYSNVNNVKNPQAGGRGSLSLQPADVDDDTFLRTTM